MNNEEKENIIARIPIVVFMLIYGLLLVILITALVKLLLLLW